MTDQSKEPPETPAEVAADQSPQLPKLSRATLRKINKVATGPLLGGLPASPAKRPSTGELAARISPLGSILSVKARLSMSLEGDGKH